MNHNESVSFRENIVTQLNYDIFAISESHLRPNESITLNGYTWYGHNRTQLSMNVVQGSGGVVFLSNTQCSPYSMYMSWINLMKVYFG